MGKGVVVVVYLAVEGPWEKVRVPVLVVLPDAWERAPPLTLLRCIFFGSCSQGPDGQNDTISTPPRNDLKSRPPLVSDYEVKKPFLI